MSERTEPCTQDEFDLLLSWGHVDAEGKITDAGKRLAGTQDDIVYKVMEDSKDGREEGATTP